MASSFSTRSRLKRASSSRDLRDILRFLALQAARMEERVEQIGLAAQIGPDPHVLQHRELMKQPDILEGAGDTTLCKLIGLVAGEKPPAAWSEDRSPCTPRFRTLPT